MKLLRFIVLFLPLACLLTKQAPAAQQVINTGTNANDGTGDTLRAAWSKANANFTELYTVAATNKLNNVLQNAIISGYGDSMTQGWYGASTNYSYLQWLSQISGIQFTNNGIGGITSSQILTIVSNTPDQNNNLIIFWAGRNDIPTTPGNVIPNYQKMVAQVQAQGNSNYILLTILNWNSETNGGDTNYVTVTNLNAQIMTTFPGHALDVRSVMVSTNAFGILGLTPTAADIVAISHDLPAPSLTGVGHPNNYGAMAIAWMIYSNWFPAAQVYKVVGRVTSQINPGSTGIATTLLPKANNQIAIGNLSGANAPGASSSIFLGQYAGDYAANATESFFSGEGAGAYATNAATSVFLGWQAGFAAVNSYDSVFIGTQAGRMYSRPHTLIIDNGDNGTNSFIYGEFDTRNLYFNANLFAASSHFNGTVYGNYFLGDGSLLQNVGIKSLSPTANNQILIGNLAGANAPQATSGLFIGQWAGDYATNATESIFLGEAAGAYATNAMTSVFLGWQAGAFATNSANSVFIGTSAGKTLSRANTLAIDNQDLGSGSLIYGEFDNRKVSIGGTLTVTGMRVATWTVGPGTNSYMCNTNISFTFVNTGVATAIGLPVPVPAMNGWMHTIKDKSGAASTNNITITPSGGAIDGAANAVINTSRGMVRIICDGTNYFLL